MTGSRAGEAHLKLVELEADDDSPIRRHPHLVIVDSRDGTQVERCPGCEERDAIIENGTAESDGLLEQVRSMATKLANLRRDKEKEMRGSELWPKALELVAYWALETGRKKGRTRLTPKRFEMIEPFLKKADPDTGLDGLAMAKLAVAGAAYDPYKADKPNKNGSLEVYDSLETIFKNRAAFERHVARAPRERLREVKDAGGFGEPFTEIDLRIKAEVMLALEGGYELEGAERELAVSAAIERARAELMGEKPAPDDRPEA